MPNHNLVADVTRAFLTLSGGHSRRIAAAVVAVPPSVRLLQTEADLRKSLSGGPFGHVELQLRVLPGPARVVSVELERRELRPADMNEDLDRREA